MILPADVISPALLIFAAFDFADFATRHTLTLLLSIDARYVLFFSFRFLLMLHLLMPLRLLP